MKSEYPIHLLAGIKSLTPKELEKTLKANEKKIFLNESWNSKSKKQGIFIDLSQVKWVNLSSAMQLALFIESAKKAQIQVYIALPTKHLTPYEINSESKFDKKYILEKRNRANSFLKTIQFDRAIYCGHIENAQDVKITEDYNFKKDESVFSENFNEAFKKQYSVIEDITDYSLYDYEYILPMTWIDSKGLFKDLGKFEERLEEILSHHERGLSRIIDVRSIKNVILSELLKNVREHAGEATNHALFSVGLFKSSSLYGRSKDEIKFNVNDIENEYIQWIINNNIRSMIEIYFGDSGVGIVTQKLRDAYVRNKGEFKSSTKNLKKIELLEWAFDKWSTSKIEETIRGTKGLYRINRIVNKYNGIFLVRNGRLLGGYQKGGYSSAKWIDNNRNSDKDYVYIPGTLIQVKLFPSKEATRFSLRFSKFNNNQSWLTRRYVLSDRDRNFQDSKNLINVMDFSNELKENIKKNSNLLLIIKIDEKAKDRKDFLNRINQELKRLSYFRHPNGVVVYFEDKIFTDDEIENDIDSINKLILEDIESFNDQEIKHPNFEDVYDPVLILEKNYISWVGGDPVIIEILNEISQTNKNRIQYIESFNKLEEPDKEKILLHFRNDNSLVMVSENGEIKFNFSNINEHFPKLLKDKLRSDYHQLICSPKLKVLDEWYNIEDIFQEEDVITFAIGIYFKFIERYKIMEKTSILIDHNQNRKLATEFAEICGIDPVRNLFCTSDDIDDHVPRRTPLFRKGDNVIVITSFISSSESIRRLIKYVKRDLANPICILSLTNDREYDIEKLETWGDKTEINSIHQKYELKEEVIKKIHRWDLSYYQKKLTSLCSCEKIVQPSYSIIEPLRNDKKIAENAILDKQVKNHFIKTKTLHYGHIGKVNGRHFTFYIDKEKFLQKAYFLFEECNHRITEWIGEKKIDKFTLVKPEFTSDGTKALESLCGYICSNFRERMEHKTYRWNSYDQKIERRNILYIDFGILTGNSINRLLTNIKKEAENIFILIIFSQFNNNEFDFYKQIKSIHVKRRKATDKDQLSFDYDINEGDFEDKGANVKSDFIYNLPLNFYDSSNCPICEHQRVLEYYIASDQYMNDFANDRKKRLNITSRENIEKDYPCDYYVEHDDFEKKYEISSIVIVEMFELRLLIEKAKIDTRYRIKLLKFIYDIYSNMSTEIKNSESKLYAFLYLISHEVLWLQREPLVFKDFRYLTTKISLAVANTKITELEAYFEHLSYNCLPTRLAVRYKYAAITVLRSSNKLMFCENISKIILSSIHSDGRMSDNLMQNTFYHIISLHKNNYNKSKKYFSVINDELSKIKKSELKLIMKQKISLNRMYSMNKRSLITITEYPNNMSDLEIVVSLKDEYEKNYQNHPPNHSDPEDRFEALDLSQLDEKYYDDVRNKRNDSVYFKNVSSCLRNLSENWDCVHPYIVTVVDNLLINFSNEILESDFFKEHYIYEYLIRPFSCKMDRLSEVNKIERFNDLIFLISRDIENLFIYYKEYQDLYGQILDHIIKSSSRNHNGSTLIQLVKDIPSYLLNSINAIFDQTKFKNCNILCDKEVPIFYPIRSLEKLLRLILKNINKKRYPNIQLTDIDINISICEREIDNSNYVTMVISNNLTNPFPHKENGSLEHLKHDLQKYRGDLNHYQENSIYITEVRFLKYER